MSHGYVFSTGKYDTQFLMKIYGMSIPVEYDVCCLSITQLEL